MFKELTVAEWRIELDRALKFRNKYGLEEHWPELRNMFYNVHPGMGEGPNIVASEGDSLLSTLTVPSPKFGVTAMHPESVQSSPIIECVDNMLVKGMKMKPAVERASLSTYVFGRGILKLGYDSQSGYDNRFDVGLRGMEEGYTLTQFDRRGNRIEFGRAAPGMPWMDSVMPQDFLVPWGTIELDTAPWCAHRVIRHVEDIKADQKYDNTRDLRPIMSMEDFVKSYQTVHKSYRYESARYRDRTVETIGKAEFCELWEIHDRRTGKIFVIATGYDKFLRNDVDLMQFYGQLPFVSFSFIPSLDSFWVTPDVHYLRQHQAQLTDIAIQARKQRRINVLRFMVARGKITEEELTKLMSSDVGVAAWVEEGVDNLDEVIKTFQPGTNQVLYSEADEVRSNAREAIGMSSNQTGEYEGSGRRSATEASIVNQRSNVRTGRRQNNVADVYEECIKKINVSLFKYWKRPTILRFTDRDGAEKWGHFTGDMLEGDYQYSVDLFNEADDSPDARKQLVQQLYPTLSQDPRVDPIPLARWAARMINDPSFLTIFKPGILQGNPNANVQLPVPGQGMQPPQPRPVPANGPGQPAPAMS